MSGIRPSFLTIPVESVGWAGMRLANSGCWIYKRIFLRFRLYQFLFENLKQLNERG